jgi:iron complex outermembrane receptor protein
LQSGNLLDALKSAPGLVVRNNQLAMLGKDAVRMAMQRFFEFFRRKNYYPFWLMLLNTFHLYNENRFSITTSYEFTFTPWWNARTVLFYSHSLSNALDPNDNVKLSNGANLYGSINNRLTLNKAKTISSEINFWYDNPFSANLYSFGTAYSLDIAVHFKSIVKGLDLTIGAYDIFNSSPRTITSFNNGVQHDFMVYPSNRYVRVSLAFNFGNNKISTRDRDFGNEDVRRRSN